MIRIGLLLALAACSSRPSADELRAPPPLRPAPIAEPSPRAEPAPVAWVCDGFCVDWQMVVEGKQLRIDFVVHNRTAAIVSVVNQLAGSPRRPDMVVIRAATESDTVAFTRGWVPLANGFNQYHPDAPPKFADVAAGADYSGTVHAPLPLGPWRFDGPVYAIGGLRELAIFEIAYDDHSSPKSNPRDLPMLRGPKHRLPHHARLPTPDEQRAANPDSVAIGPEPGW